jgi:RNA methyltransferase, TrmH family
VARARELLRPAGRKEAGRFLIDGPQAVREALAAGVVEDLFLTDDAGDRFPEFLDSGATTHVVEHRVIEALSSAVTPQGVVAVAPLISIDVATALSACGPGRPLVVLDAIADPGNAGAVLRVADAAGAGAVVFSAKSVDVHNAKCVRSAAGSLWHLPVATGADVSTVLSQAKDHGLQILAADGSGTAIDDAVAAGLDLSRPTAWVFGNEAHGLSEASFAAADSVLAIPLLGKAESLNLATASAVFLYAGAFAGRLRGAPGAPS